MVDFLKKRLQVFVSSTFTDLREERQAAVEAILAAGHIPAGMELFAAGNESQMEAIQQWIDESDVYLLILAGRYGSIDPKSGKSYTRLEYEYSLEKRKEAFACILKDTALNDRVKKGGMEMIDKNQKELDEFRELVKTKVVEFWEDSKDIQNIILKKLGQLARREDLVGWVRPNTQVDLPAVTEELASLSSENAKLRAEMNALHAMIRHQEERLALEKKQELHILGMTYSELKRLLMSRQLWEPIRSNRQHYAGPVGATRESLFLESLGLMHKSDRNYNIFELTEAGRTFFNRIEIEENR